MKNPNFSITFDWNTYPSTTYPCMPEYECMNREGISIDEIKYMQ